MQQREERNTTLDISKVLDPYHVREYTRKRNADNWDHLAITREDAERTEESDIDIFSNCDDSDVHPTYQLPTCDVRWCKRFSRNVTCFALLCYGHFTKLGPCENDLKHYDALERPKENEKIQDTSQLQKPENFQVEGNEREERLQPKEIKESKKKVAHSRRIQGMQYVSPKTGKPMTAKSLK